MNRLLRMLRHTMELAGHFHTIVWLLTSLGGAGVILAVFHFAGVHLPTLGWAATFVVSAGMIVLAMWITVKGRTTSSSQEKPLAPTISSVFRPRSESKGRRVERAIFGADGYPLIDVTKQVETLTRKGEKFFVNYDVLGLPQNVYQGATKYLTVTLSETRAEGEAMEYPIHWDKNLARTSPASQPESVLEIRARNALKAEFDPLPWHEKLVLYVIYKQPLKIHHLDLVQKMKEYGYSRSLLDVINPVTERTNFVKTDLASDIERHPVNYKIVEELLEEWKKYAIP